LRRPDNRHRASDSICAASGRVARRGTLMRSFVPRRRQVLPHRRHPDGSRLPGRSSDDGRARCFTMLLTDGRVASGTYDGFVVGSGPAGLSVALALAEANKRVLVFESGDAQTVRSELANTIGYGHFSGSYWNAHWIRTLGGTSAVWNGWCSTLRAVDFDSPVVGVRWPIRRADLSDYYARAATILDHDAALIDLETPVVPGFSYRPIPIAGPTRFGRKYFDTLRSTGGVDVAVGCSVVRLEADDGR